MPKRSAESLITPAFPAPQIWPSPPAICASPRQREVWQQLVTSRPVDFWDPTAKALLGMLVVHLVGFEMIDAEITRELDSVPPDDARVQKLIAMRGAESKSASALAARLRLAASSNMSPERSFRESVRGRHVTAEKPWNARKPKEVTDAA